MGAWGQAHKADGKVMMLADTKADFARATGLEVDLKDVLGSVRCKRDEQKIRGYICISGRRGWF